MYERDILVWMAYTIQNRFILIEILQAPLRKLMKAINWLSSKFLTTLIV